jgi:putative sterol carrier protein
MTVSRNNFVTRLIAGRSELEITAEIQHLGVDSVLGQVFSMIAAAFIPEASAIDSAVVQFDVTAPDGIHSYQLKFAEQKCVVLKAKGEAARLTISFTLAVFLRIVGGDLDGMQEFVSGRVRLGGDVLLAQAMRSWFNRQPGAVSVGSFS